MYFSRLDLMSTKEESLFIGFIACLEYKDRWLFNGKRGIWQYFANAKRISLLETY